jgi:hypothetical protein
MSLVRTMGVLAASALVACSSSDGATDAPMTSPTTTPPGSDAGAPNDAAAATDVTDAAKSDAGAGPVTACPTSGMGAINAPGTACLVVTPAQTGAAATGENATVPSYVLAPTGTRRDQLVVFFNASESHPGNQIADPAESFYTAATSQGYSVIALSYSSAQIIGAICATDACYGPTRETILRGAFQTGASPKVQTLTADEGAVPRLVLLLRWLDANDSSHGWSAFLEPASASKPAAEQVVWSKVVTVGHSQGGGHAAMMGKIFPISRVIQLSSTCDQVGGVAVSWTDAAVGTWQTAPPAFWGLAAPSTFSGGKPTSGDTICGYHTAVWQNLGMTAEHSNDAAATCGATGQLHGVSVGCKDNYPTWQAMLQ